jgi:hypothetical protein
MHLPRDRVSASFASLAHSAMADLMRAWPKDEKRDALLYFVWLLHRASEPAVATGSTDCDHGDFLRHQI